MLVKGCRLAHLKVDDVAALLRISLPDGARAALELDGDRVASFLVVKKAVDAVVIGHRLERRKAAVACFHDRVDQQVLAKGAPI